VKQVRLTERQIQGFIAAQNKSMICGHRQHFVPGEVGGRHAV
jgi:hypothetical protein